MRTITRMLAVCMLTWAFVASAQPKTAPSWSTKFKTAIKWQRVHSLGYLIVDTNDALYGINPADGKILWANPAFASLDPQYYQEVEGTEFVTIAYQTGSSSTIPMQAIINVENGKVLFDSDKEKIGVLSQHVLPASGRLL